MRPWAGRPRGRAVPQALSVVAGLLAAAVLLGWAVVGAGWAGTGLPGPDGGGRTPPLTALALLLLVLALHAGRDRRTRAVAAGLGALVAGAMTSVLVQAGGGPGLGLERLIAPDAVAAAGLSGRPSPQAAVMFLMLGLAVGLRTVAWGRLAAELAAVVAAIVGAIAATGRVVGWDALSQVDAAAAAPLLATLGGLLVALTLIDPFDGPIRSTRPACRWCAAAVGLALTISLTLGTAHNARADALREQAADLRLAADATRSATAPVISALDDLATLYAPTGAVPRAQLTLAAGKLLRRRAVTVVSVLRQLEAAERPAFERRHGPITDPDGRRTPPRRSYTVIADGRSRAAPASGPRRLVDLAADPVRGPALRLALRTGRAAASAPVRSLESGTSVIAVYLPVRRLSGARSAVRVAVLFDTAALARTITAALPQGTGARVADGGLSFAGGPAAARSTDPATVVPVAGRRWVVRIDPVRPLRAGVLAAAGVGLSVTLLLVLGVGLLVRREQVAHALALRGARERDAATRAAAEARRHSRFLEENATDVLLLAGPQGTLTYLSPAVGRLLGFSPDQLRGQRLADLAHPLERARIDELLAQLRRTDATVDVTYRMRHRDGRWLWVETLLRAVHDPASGGLVEVQGSLRDRTRRREGERRLREAENRFRSAFDSAPVGMAVVGLEGEILQINRALAALADWDGQGLRGTAFDALLHQADADTHREAREALIHGEQQAHDAELRLVQLSGRVIWTAVSTAVVRGGDGLPTHFLVQVQDVSARRHAEGQLQHLADHDPLTGLLNRRAFERSLREHLDRVRRYGVGGAVLVVDLDRFAVVNERLGHGRGDDLLAGVAHALRTRLRGSDLLARFGGDGFAVLLPHAGMQDALRVGGALVDAVRGLALPDDVPPLTASVGVALVDRPEQRGDELLIDADLAMYDAKQAGRDRVRQAFRAPGGLPRPRAAAADDAAGVVRAALREDRLVLHAAPVIDLQHGGVLQLELRLRVRGRDGDLHGPASLLAIAGHHELVQELDRWVIARAAALLAAHPDGPGLAVTVALRSLAGEVLVDTLAEELTTQRVDARRLSIQLGEREAVTHVPRVQELARDLRHLGCPLALDDYGGGYGSFYFLRHLPFDMLKIDGGFVRRCAGELEDQLVIRVMADLAGGLGARTVAKSVRDEATADVLRSLGVDAAQGRHLGGPLPVEQAFAAARARRAGGTAPER